MQKFLMLMNTDVAPIKKASKSVIDVIVMATPHFLSMNCILSLTEATGKGGASAIPDINMNMSSIPMPLIL